MDNNKCSSKESSTTSSNKEKLDLRLYEFSYADYVLFSSTIAYAIGENLNDPDLDILISFFGMITSDLAILRTRRGIIDGLAKAKSNTESESVIGATESIQGAEEVSSNLSRKSKRVRKVKKRKIRKNNKNIK